MISQRLHRERSDRGSTFIIVIAILSLLVLIATTLSFTSRLEIVSASNFSEGVQSRVGAVTGVARAAELFAQEVRFTSLTQQWAQPDGYRAVQTGQMAQPAEQHTRLFESSLSEVYIFDESAKINVNTADEQTLEALFASLLGKNNLPAGLAPTLAQEIVRHRLGPDGNPGEPDTPHEFIGDPRLPPFGDDKPFYSLEELLLLPNFTQEIYSALEPCLTIFSASEETYSSGGEMVRKCSINYAPVSDIYSALRARFPQKPDELLMQFAANIMDFRDADAVPTVFPGSDPDHPILGIEQTPYINEVFPDSPTLEEDGDDGQYVELYNPYSHPISIEGWQLKCGGSIAYLNGSIAPKGFVIVTDDYNEANDPTPEDEEKGYGSFYDIFGLVPNGTTKRIIEEPALNIPNASGTIYLRDAHGNLIDYFYYLGGVFAGANMSLQRNDPRVRFWQRLTCTPFALNANYSPEDLDDVRFAADWQDHPFRSPAEVMYVFSGWATAGGHQGIGWIYPGIASSTDVELDCQIIDLFTLINFDARPVALDEKNDETRGKDLPPILLHLKSPPVIGRVNINTAPLDVLQALPELDKEDAERVVSYRQGIPAAEAGPTTPFSPFVFNNISDLLYYKVVWPNKSEKERIEEFINLANLITVKSRSCSVISRSTPPKGILTTNPNRIALKAILATDEQPTRVVYWRYLN
jgi:type II secretory pathway component PulK